MNLSHLNSNEHPQMVDISKKEDSIRTARAQATIELSTELHRLLVESQFQTKKGNVLTIAFTAGIMAAKNTSNLIPLCHPIPLHKIEFTYFIENNFLIFNVEAKTKAETGIEMEALTAASVAALTFYDMTKSISKGTIIKEIKLLQKTGGKSGDFYAQ